MSLRRDIHAAFDEIAPPLGGMPERMVQTVLSDKQRRKKGMTYRARVPLPLVAIFVVIALVASVFIGNQLIRAWIASHGPSPAGQVHLTALQQLEARPLKVQTFRSIEDCPTSPSNPEGSIGGGPLYGDPGSAATTGWGEYFYLVLYTDTAINGPILVRARDVLKPATVAFAGPFAAGPAVGTDVVDGKQYTRHPELVLDESRALASPLPGWPNNHHRYFWDVLAGVPAGSIPGSTGWQIDGATFTEVFYTC